MSKAPKALSPGEEAFALHCRAEKMEVVREFQFDPNRKWRFDFVIAGQTVAVEIEGGTWNAGRHMRGAGFIKDCEKYNAAAKQGWTVLRYTTEMVLDGTAINDVLEMLDK